MPMQKGMSQHALNRGVCPHQQTHRGVSKPAYAEEHVQMCPYRGACPPSPIQRGVCRLTHAEGHVPTSLRRGACHRGACHRGACHRGACPDTLVLSIGHVCWFSSVWIHLVLVPETYDPVLVFNPTLTHSSVTTEKTIHSTGTILVLNWYYMDIKMVRTWYYYTGTILILNWYCTATIMVLSWKYTGSELVLN